ncbi:hypothetical protein AYI70_g10082 [Smittium culicis]|uniref:Uncharacterized protein n=1 Tax=Smittium culicis TaxID=133412 RepID=A0A1R1X8A1_9FUNG|nr:hypothetical protein AYI70_g10082 [Smittium culicis]
MSSQQQTTRGSEQAKKTQNFENVFTNDGSFMERFRKVNAPKSGADSKAEMSLARRIEFEQVLKNRRRPNLLHQNGITKFGSVLIHEAGIDAEGADDKGKSYADQSKGTAYSKQLREYASQLSTDDADRNRPLVK